jgi:integrase
MDHPHRRAEGGLDRRLRRPEGSRHIETFKKKKAADAFAQQVGVDIRAATHTPSSRSIIVDEAVADWVKTVELEGRERSTVRQYRQHVKHIVVWGVRSSPT